MIPIHPKIIHFPIALLISAVLFALLALFIKNKREFFKEIMYWNILLGTIGAVFAIITGLIAENNLAHNDAIHEIMETHELLGYIIAGAFVIITIWLFLRKSKMQFKELALLTFFLLISSGLLAYSASLGGQMVYELGAGVEPMESIINNQTHEHNHGIEDMHEHENVIESADTIMVNEPMEHDHEGHEH